MAEISGDTIARYISRDLSYPRDAPTQSTCLPYGQEHTLITLTSPTPTPLTSFFFSFCTRKNSDNYEYFQFESECKYEYKEIFKPEYESECEYMIMCT